MWPEYIWTLGYASRECLMVLSKRFANTKDASWYVELLARVTVFLMSRIVVNTVVDAIKRGGHESRAQRIVNVTTVVVFVLAAGAAVGAIA